MLGAVFRQSRHDAETTLGERNNMKYITSAVVIALVCVANVFATAQYPDKLNYKGTEHSLYTNPMEPYFEKHPEKRPEGGSTALWRGYVATFGIVSNLLVLTEIEIQDYGTKEDGSYKREWKSIKRELFSELDVVPIDWFTGILTLPQGEVENYVHMGYGSTYSHYILLEIENGKFRKERNLTSEQYKEFRNRQFEEFKKTKEYKDAVKELGASVPDAVKELGGSDPERDEQFIRSYFSGTISSILLDD
jgi:hypothetical protein